VIAYLIANSAASAGPSWYWYATRGLGVATLVVLTATVVLGISTTLRWSGETTPGFVFANLHRNLSLIAVLLVVGHAATTVLDPYAHLTVRDAIVPVGAAYRPIWLGLGVAAAELLVAIVASSLLRTLVGLRAWRLIHWFAYAAWPLSVVHGLGTGSDSQAPWLIGVVASCVAAVILAVGARLWTGRLSTLPVRVAAAAMAISALTVGSDWAVHGPLHVGWAARAGAATATAIATPRPRTVHPGPGGFSDPLAGVMVRSASGQTQISMRDMVDTGLTIAIRSPTSQETLPVVTIARDGRNLCSVPATAGETLYAVCEGTRLTIKLSGPASASTTGGQIGAQLVTSGPLN
jgi:methionine sulfoxide reductase heme-binding subunit